jgi:transcriptional regulator with XRE-family HTH domain
MTTAEFRALRQRLGLTREQMAELLDVSPSTISNYEGAGRPPVRIPRVVAMACETLETEGTRG